MTNLFKRLLFIAAVLMLVGFVLNIAVDNPYTHRLVRTVINKQIAVSTSVNVDFKALKVGLFPPSLDLYGLSVRPKAEDPGPPLVTASHVGFRLSMWDLLMGRLHLHRVEANDAEVVWDSRPALKELLADLGPSAPSPSSGPQLWPPELPLPVDQLRLTNSRIFVQLPKPADMLPKGSPFTYSAVGVDLEVEASGWTDINLQLKSLSSHASFGPASVLEDGKTDLIAELSGRKITIPRFRIGSRRLEVSATGLVTLDTSPTPDLRPVRTLDGLTLQFSADHEGDLSVLGSVLDIGGTRGFIQGKADVDATLPLRGGDPASFEIRGEGKARNAYLSDFQLFDSKIHYRVDGDAIHFPEIQVIDEGTHYAEADGRIDFGSGIPFHFEAKPTNLRFFDLMRALTVDFDIFDASVKTPKIVIDGRDDPLRMTVRSDAVFEDVALPFETAGSGLPECRFDISLAITKDWLDFGETSGHCYAEEAVSTPTEEPPAKPADSPFRLSGRVHFDEVRGMDLKVESPSFDWSLAQAFPGRPVSGKGELKTRIHGPYDDLSIDLATRAAPLTVGSLEFATVAADLTVRPDEDRLDWQQVVFKPKQGGRITSDNGTLHLEPPFRVEGEVAAKNGPSSFGEAAFRTVGTEVVPSFRAHSFEARITGPLTRPIAMTGRIEWDLRDGHVDDEKIFDESRGRLTTDEGPWRGSDLMVQNGDLTMEAALAPVDGNPLPHDGAGSKLASVLHELGLPEEKDYRLTFETSATPTPKNEAADKPRTQSSSNQLDDLPYAGSYLTTLDLAGRLELNGTLRVRARGLQGTVSGKLSELSAFGSRMAPVFLRGFIDKSRLKLTTEHSGNSLKGRLTVDLMKPGLPYEWYLSFERMDLRALGSRLFHTDARNFAYLTADWTMSGRFDRWWDSRGELTVKDFRARYVRDIAAQTKQFNLNLDHPTTIEFRPDGWRFPADDSLYLKGDSLRFRLSLGEHDPPEKLDVRLDSVVDMELAQQLFRDVDTATGKIKAVAALKGSVENPEPAVQVNDLKPNPFIAATWKPVSIGFADFRPPLRNIRIAARYRDQQLVIDSFSSEKGVGTVTANGTLNFSGEGANSRLDINLNETTVVYPVAFLKNFETELSGDVTVSGQGLPFTIAGDLSIDRARSTEELDIRDEIIDALRKQSFSTELVKEQAFARFNLNLTADESVRVHNRNLQAVLSTNLQVQGTDIAPSISGQVKVDKGKFTYKQDFDITRGLVTFDNPVKTDPSLDILAVSNVSTYKVYLSITGRASNPTVEFSIDPPTREDGSPISKMEILVLLSRGSLPDANQSFGDTQSAATSEALNLIMGQFEEPVEKLFDLSGQSVVRNVYIDTYPSDEGTPVPRLNLPLDLGEEFDVVVRADQSSNQVATEYDLHENIRVSGKVNVKNENSETRPETREQQNAEYELDLKFRFSFD